jgi:homocysteine S-methyltransferase
MGNTVTILDGGMGRLLEKMGAPFRLPEWSALAVIEAPEYVAMAHQAFIDSGAEIIITNTYSLVPLDIGQERFDEKGRGWIKLAAKIARDTADKNNKSILVAGSIPPAFGSYRPDLFIAEKADDIFIPQIEEQESFVDMFLGETVSSTTEAKTIGRLVKERSTKPLWISYTLKDREGENIPPQLRSGQPVEEAVKTALAIDAKALLFNCSQPEEMAPTLEIVQKMNIGIPYGVYANAFTAIKEDKVVHDGLCPIRNELSPIAYLEMAKIWKNLGATIIGGCCGINPEHIKELTKINEN